jgi:hypothetical protein
MYLDTPHWSMMAWTSEATWMNQGNRGLDIWAEWFHPGGYPGLVGLDYANSVDDVVEELLIFHSTLKLQDICSVFNSTPPPTSSNLRSGGHERQSQRLECWLKFHFDAGNRALERLRHDDRPYFCGVSGSGRARSSFFNGVRFAYDGALARWRLVVACLAKTVLGTALAMKWHSLTWMKRIQYSVEQFVAAALTTIAHQKFLAGFPASDSDAQTTLFD